MLHQIFAIGLSLLLGGLALLHFHWAAGGRWGAEGVVPTKDGKPLFEPGALASSVVGLSLLAAVFLALWRAGLVDLPLPSGLARIAIWLLVAAFFLRAVGEFRYVGFFKSQRGSLFAQRDSRYYSPLCLLIAGLAAGVAIWSP